MNTLVVGGRSGLGLELAKYFVKRGPTYITGTSLPSRLPRNDGLRVMQLYIGQDSEKLSLEIDEILSSIEFVDTLVWAAGFYQDGLIDRLDASDLVVMANVGLVGPAAMLSKIIKRQGYLGCFIPITSTSQWIPRLKEPMYAATKRGLAALAESVSLDDRIRQTLLVVPAGMQTNFWKGTGKDTRGMLDPAWVAEQVILELYGSGFRFRELRINRDPSRVEIVQDR